MQIYLDCNKSVYSIGFNHNKLGDGKRIDNYTIIVDPFGKGILRPKVKLLRKQPLPMKQGSQLPTGNWLPFKRMTTLIVILG